MIFARRPGHEPLPPDRPVIVEPVPLPEPSPPFRIRLGDAVHLNGAIPRGTPLQDATPRRCKVCGGLFLVFGKAIARARYCQECRAKKCPCCNGAGGKHYPYCSTLKPRPCRGCGVELGHGGSLSPYCTTCQGQRCSECQRYAGRHSAHCRYELRRRRPGLTERYGVVTEDEIVALYLEHRAYAIRLAHSIVGAEAEDIVHDVVTYMLEKREYLTAVPGKSYFLRAVKHGALRRLRYAWRRYTVLLDPEDLLIAEQMMARGETSDNTVRLPSPGAGGVS